MLIFMLMLSVACGKKSSTSSGNKINQIFVKGNPLVMVNGTEKNKTSFITTSNLDEFNDYVLSGIYIFAQKEIISTEESQDIEAGQEATEEDQTEKDLTVFNMRKAGLGYTFENTRGQISLGFENVAGRLELDHLKLGHTLYGVEIEHYSISPDKSKMSFLLRLETRDDGHVLLSATFYKNSSKQTISKTSTSYHYLYGKGVMVPWKLDATRKVTVDVCPGMEEHMPFSQVKSAIEAWEEPFRYKTQKLDIVVREAASCKPFSDVNEHAIHYINKYLTMPDKDAYNPGFAMIHSDLARGNIFDADIVILGSEIAKDKNYGYMQKNRTMTHEFGHFLGLDHQFDGPMSIMSYDRVYSLYTYDFSAITELYK